MPDGSPITNVGDKRYRASTQSRTRNLSPVMPDGCYRASRIFSLPTHTLLDSRRRWIPAKNLRE